jgi:undecaprenyl-diphosphatase
VTLWLHEFAAAHAWLTPVVIVATAAALACGALLFLAGAYRHAEPTRMVVAGCLGLVAATLVCKVIANAHPVTRPFVTFGFDPLFPHARNASFPSSLTAWAAVGAGVALLASRRLGLVLLAGTGMVAFGCVYVGVHWVSDVLAGAGLGLLAGMAAWQACGAPAVRRSLVGIDAPVRRRQRGDTRAD